MGSFDFAPKKNSYEKTVKADWPIGKGMMSHGLDLKYYFSFEPRESSESENWHQLGIIKID